jgi:hypothetical protein
MNMDRFVDVRADIYDADDGRFAVGHRLVEASVGRHSEKPLVLGEIIEIYFPTLPKVDLHTRRHSASRLGRLGPGGAAVCGPLQD